MGLPIINPPVIQKYGACSWCLPPLPRAITFTSQLRLRYPFAILQAAMIVHLIF